MVRVTEDVLTYVATDDDCKPRPYKPKVDILRRS